MASIEEHVCSIENQLECMTEHGHLKHPNEYWAMHDVLDAIKRLRMVFGINSRCLDDD